MTGVIWLICEDKTDRDVIQALLTARGINIRVEYRKLRGDVGGIGRLAAQADGLIREVLLIRGKNDCVAVFHDADTHTKTHDEHHKKIEECCIRHKVKLIIAHDEIESWLLADSGLCQWLQQKQANHDGKRKPSDILNSWLDTAGKLKYQDRGRLEVLKKLKGDGDKKSKSMKDALKHLENAPCMK